MKQAIVFSGQGAQFSGMGREMFDAFECARDVFLQIDDALNRHLSRLMFEGDEAELTATQNAQPAIFACSMATVATIEKLSGKKISEIFSFAAGHSLGEYGALCASGVFDVPTTAKLLQKRGEFMAQAAQSAGGGMAAIIGLDTGKIAQICAESQEKTGEVCVVANDNAPAQTVISGQTDALEQAMRACTESGAKRALKLNVAGAFHSPLMQKACDKMNAVLSETAFNDPTLPVLTDAFALPAVDAAQIREALSVQMVKGVRWREIMAYMESRRVERVVEAGAGAVLKGLVKRNSAVMTGVSPNAPAEIEEFLKSI